LRFRSISLFDAGDFQQVFLHLFYLVHILRCRDSADWKCFRRDTRS